MLTAREVVPMQEALKVSKVKSEDLASCHIVHRPFWVVPCEIDYKVGFFKQSDETELFSLLVDATSGNTAVARKAVQLEERNLSGLSDPTLTPESVGKLAEKATLRFVASRGMIIRSHRVKEPTLIYRPFWEIRYFDRKRREKRLHISADNYEFHL